MNFLKGWMMKLKMVNYFYCRMCGVKLDIYSYRSALFCSNKCRTKYHRVMQELRQQDPIKSIENVTGNGFEEALRSWGYETKEEETGN